MKKKFRFQGGAFLLFLLFAGLFFLLLARIVTIQATGQAEGQELAAKAAARYSQEEKLKAERGKILDRNGDIIAEDTLTYKLVAVLDEAATGNSKTQRHVTDVEKTAGVLAEHLGIPADGIRETLQNGIDNDRYQVEFGSAGREISHTQMLELEKEKLSGVLFVENLKRLYPNGIFASHLIGFAMKEELEDGTSATKGIMGLEATYDEALTGSDGKMEFNTDNWGFLLANDKSLVEPAIDGSDIRLTLDRTLQNFLEDAMSTVQAEYAPTRMIAIVADPKTGEILSMAQRPTFNPNTREGLSDNWLNESVELTIEPGSPMKVFTLAAAIEEGKWDPNAWYESGTYRLGPDTIGDHNGRRGWGSITFLEGFQRSSNVAMAYLLERLGPDNFMEYVDAFGFGQKTGIDLPNEVSGKLLDTYASEILTLTYGQGSTVTPIQMIQAATAIGNEGRMMKPFVIDEIVNPETGEVTVKRDPEQAGQPISAQTAAEVLDVMASTVTGEFGSAKAFALQDYTVAGKTGTAEIPGPSGGYMKGHGNFLYSFLGFAPAEDPELLMYVAIQQPNLPVTEYGSIPVSKIFKPVIENGLKHLNIKPENVESVNMLDVESYEGQPSSEIAAQLAEAGANVVLVGQGGEIGAQYPAPGQQIVEGGTIMLKTEGATVLPDFTGWAKREILAFQSLSGLSLEIVGEGYAAGQSLSAGLPADNGSPVVIQLETPEASYKNQMLDGPEGMPEETDPDAEPDSE